ncbi:MAG: nucleotidyltransferase domain-containing protein [Candidatus Woesearchaeota archaeon]
MVLKRSILKLLIENKTKQFTIREISKILNKDYKNVYDSIQNLTNSINLDKRGNASYISYKPILTNDIYQTETFRKNSINLPLIMRDLDSIKNPFFIAILFGSYAKNTQTKNSDIDLCIIHNNEIELKNILNKLAIHPKIEIQSFHHLEFVQMLKIKEFNIAHEIYEHGIILKNIELYYEVIKLG